MSGQQKASEIGYFKDPSAPTEVQRSSPKPRGSTSPFRQVRQEAGLESTDAGFQSAFQRQQVKTKQKATIGPQIGTATNLQSAFGIVQQTPTAIPAENAQNARSLQQVDENGEINITSEVLHFMADPQILVNHVTNPRELPRSIALERRRRAIASVDFLQQFQQFVEALRRDDEDFAARNHLGVQGLKRLPVDIFDDISFETKNIPHWFAGGRFVEIYDALKMENRNVRSLHAHCCVGLKWQKCLVIGSRRLNGHDRLLVQLAGQAQQKVWVPRLYVFIWGEDPERYVARLYNALRMRNQAESLIRYDINIQNMPIDGLVSMSQEGRDRVANYVELFDKRHTVLGVYIEEYIRICKEVKQKYLQPLLDQVAEHYLVSQNHILFKISLLKQPSLVQELQLSQAVENIEHQHQKRYCDQVQALQPYINMTGPSNQHLFLPENTQLDQNNKPIINMETLSRNVGSFLKTRYNDIFQRISFESFLLNEEAIKALQIGQSECHRLLRYKILEEALINKSLAKFYKKKQQHSCDVIFYDYALYSLLIKSPYPNLPYNIKTYSIEEYKNMQFTHQKTLSSFLTDQWIQFLKSQLVECLKYSGKGHFNIFVENVQVYETSKLKGLLFRIMQQCCDTFRDLTYHSVKQFVQMFETFGKWKVTCEASNKVKCEHPDNQRARQYQETYETIFRMPAFNINLQVEKVQPVAEDKTILERLKNDYIYGISPLKEEQQNIDDSESEHENEQKDENATAEEILPDDPQPQVPVSQVPIAKKEEKKVDEVFLIDRFAYQTQLDEFKTIILSIFDNGFTSISKVPTIEPLVLQNIVYPRNAFIMTPNPQEQSFVDARVKIVENLEVCLAPLVEYLKTFNKFRELLYVDIDKWRDTIQYKAELYLQQQKDAENAAQGGKQEDDKEDPKKAALPASMQQAIEQAQPLSPADLRNIVHSKIQEAKDILNQVPEQVHIGAFIVKNNTIRTLLTNKCQEQAKAITQLITNIAYTKSQMISQIYFAVSRKLNHKCKNLEEVCKIDEFIKTKVDGVVSQVKSNIAVMNEYYAILDELFLAQKNDDVNRRWKTASYPKEIRAMILKAVETVNQDKNKFKEEQQQQQANQVKNFDNLTRQINGFPHKYKKVEDYVVAAEEAEKVIGDLMRIQNQCKLFNKRENLLGLPITNYSQVDQILKEFDPIAMIWKCLKDFRDVQNKVMNQDFKLVNAQEIENSIDNSFRNLSKAQRSIKENQQSLKDLSDLVKQEINDFKKHVPLIVALRNPGLRKRHWLRIGKETNVDLRRLRYINGVELKQYGNKKSDEEKSENDYTDMTAEQISEINKKAVDFTFKQAIEEYHLDIPKNFDIIQKISDVAAKEFGIETVLKQLDQTWGSVCFTLLKYQNGDTYILKALDEIIQQLDDNITMIQSMSFSPFKKYFEETISNWDYKLSLTSEIIDVWIQVQQAWLYLEPIFASPDIVKQLPTESKNFKAVDQFWIKFMNQTLKQPNVIKICTETEKLLQKLKENHKVLETVQKGLADYLETKRIAFPRFFFLSDEELLSILSNTKNPTSVQPFLRSCFENVARIKFLDENYEMVSMTSHEGEVVMFSESLIPEGNVEVWMGRLEKLIIKTVKIRTLETLKQYVEMVTKDGIKGRANWVKSGFAQGINLVNQMMFCNDTEWAIQGAYLNKYAEQLDRQLSIMTDLVREGLSKLESKCFSALLTYDVFQRDVVDGLLQSNVDSVGNFDWARHPKHYCNVESLYLQPLHQPQDNYYQGNFNPQDYMQKNIKKIMDEISGMGAQFLISYNQILSTLPYAFEYLGNTQRLVITPLTLKIYVTISQSQAMFRFSAASGPAGSGKTETSKQMTNKEFGLVCVVFNCSEGLDLIGIRRMLSGVISTGGCLVMDEINRLSLDVLSVFAQMVLSVQIGLQSCGGSIVKQPANSFGKTMAHIQTSKFVFEGVTELLLQSTATVIITQNPNYSGRQKLPANLVALFRAVSVMVPNYMKICQIRLYSFGFKKAASLSQKAVSVFKLCSEQLSQQSWYDYGMRAINTTIQSVGNIRQELGNLCVQSIDQIPTVPGLDGKPVPDQKYYIEDQIMLRAISETNLPKFLANDSLLFNNILKDLFPGIQQPYIDYSKLVSELNQVLRSNVMDYLQHDKIYVDKIVDLYMTINLRHGLMTLGNACSGKTSSIYSLMHALNRLNKREVDERLVKFNKFLKQNPATLCSKLQQVIPEDFSFMKMGVTRLNPKSITMDQLFGQFDAVSKEWQDGVLSTCIRNAVADYNKYVGQVESTMLLDTYDQSKPLTISDVNPSVWVQRGNYTRQIVYVCGYIDSLWIESLNTVLDDSKRLCLTSGEIIALSPVMNLLFSMDSVAEASPATISRNGMIYFTSLDYVSVGTTQEQVGEVIVNGTLKDTDYFKSYLDRLPDQFRLKNAQVKDIQQFESRSGIQEEYSLIALNFDKYLSSYIKKLISYVKVNCKQLQQMMDANLIISVFKILNSYISEIKPNDFGVIDQWQLALFSRYQEHIFIFSIIWGIGGTIADEQSRILFNKYLRVLMSENESNVSIPTDLTVFDYEMTFEKYDDCKEQIQQALQDEKPLEEIVQQFNVSWKPWGQEKLQQINLDSIIMGQNPDPKMISRLNLGEIIIPTPSNISQSILIRRLIQNLNSTLIVGQTGSGKTSVIKNYLMKHEEDIKTQVPIIMNFSANTQAGDVMNYLDSKLEKRRRGVFGAPAGKKYVFYVDDLNLPMKERYGCINSHELLRQMISHNGWFDLKEIQFKTIIDTTVVTSMCPAGGSRNPVTQRLLRHFVLLNFLEMSDKELQLIFGSLINWWSNKVFLVEEIGEQLQQSICKLGSQFVSASIDIYSDIRSNLLPTPSKMHYTFNLRDLTKLFQGFLMVEPSSIYKKGEDTEKNIICFPEEQCTSNLVKLFVHENLRVFSDRLVNQEDQDWFVKSLETIVSKHIGFPLKQALCNEEPSEILFGDFVSADRSYQMITSLDEAQTKLYEELASYNDQHSKNPMNLVLFKTAIQHLCRLSRILRQPSSNLLIIGVGGVGRFSLTSLASSLLQFDIQTIELKKGYSITDWHNDLKNLLLVCGLQQKQRVFLVQDAHIFSDRQLEDISIMLNSCDLQSYYEQADLETIYSDMKQECIKQQIPQTKINMYDCYLKRVKENLRVVLCFSPSGTTLRDRLRKFPSLVNCCSIDYMFDWPVDALTGVGRQVLGFTGKLDQSMIPTENLEFLQKFLIEQNQLNPSVSIQQLHTNITTFCVQTHRLVEQLSTKYEKEVQRYNRVTPTLFLNLLEMLIKVLQNTYNQINTYKVQLTGGLEKLESTQKQVAELQVELVNLQPELIKQTQEVEEMMVKLKADEEVAMQAQQEVSVEKTKANEKLLECQTIEKESNQKREQAEKKLESAKVALKQLDVAKLAEVGNINIPVPNVRLTTDAVCVLMGIKATKKCPNPVNQGVMIDDYWDTSKQMLSKANVMINDLLNFKKEEINEATIKKLQPYITDPRFNEKTVADSSKPCGSLVIYVLAMVDFYHNFQQVIPLRLASEKAAAELAVVQANLDELMAKLNALNDKIADLKAESQMKVQQKQLLLNQVEETSQKLNRAQTLISSLSGEKSRWLVSLQSLNDQGLNVLGDSLFAAAYSVYSGAFTSDFRKTLKTQLLSNLAGLGLKTTVKNGQEVKVTDVLSDQVTLMNYVNQYKLPSDHHSQENASMMFSSLKYCLLIDPEAQAQQFLKNYYREQGFEICKANNKDLLRSLENCIRFGKIMIIINVTNEIDPSLNSILDRQFVKEGSQLCIKLGDSFVPFNSSFRLFLCTHLANPNYKPESFVKVTVLNFAITLQGLQDQMLGVLVGLEKPDQEQLKNSLVISNSKKRVELKQLEDKVLELLNNSTGDILENIELINTLAQSQKTSAQIMQSVKESEATEAIIDETRKSYIPVAERASILYFCIQDLVKIDYMYQYSLNWYIDLYIQSIQDTEQSPNDLQLRLDNLIKHFTVFLFQTICRSLFEVHRLLFAFLMCTRIQLNEKHVSNKEIKYLLVGPQNSHQKPNPASEWLQEKSWNYICDLELVFPEEFGGLSATFADAGNQLIWRQLFEHQQPEEQDFPQPFQSRLTPFQRFLPLAAIRPDRIIAYSRIYLVNVLGDEFIQPQAFNIEKSFKDSNNIKPILFLLNDMADPISDLMSFATTMRMNRKIQVLSLGRGIEKAAIQLIQQFAERGSWCVLQNCHVAVSFLKTLEQQLEQLQQNSQGVHRDFRLWLSSQPTDEFPVSVLQNSVKVSVENPNNLKSNLLRIYQNNISEKTLQESCHVPENIEKFKKLTFSLSLFYAVLLQRKKFGSVGFNTPYPWSAADVAICIQQLPTFLDKYLEVYPKDALNYLFAGINIGGCVTDAIDQRCVDAIVQDFLDPRVYNDNWVFQLQKIKNAETPPHFLHQLTSNLSYRDYLDFIQANVPVECHPENLGLNSNSNITADRNESSLLLEDILRMYAGKLQDDKQEQQQDEKQEAEKPILVNDDTIIIQQVLKQVPKQFDIDAVQLKYPTLFEESLNSLLVQECGRYNNLLLIMDNSLKELIRALKGLTILSPELEEVQKAITMNRQPELFQKYSYPSLKPLSSYMKDLNMRVKFFNNWIEHGKPKIFNITSFFFAQGFFTSLLQNFARKYSIAIDTLGFQFSVTDQIIDDIVFIDSGNKCNEQGAMNPGDDGSFISGFYLEAARYDINEKIIVEARPRELYSKMPVLLMTPTQKESDASTSIYSCPCYRTLARFGTLSTTGHSTNFLLNIQLPCHSGASRHWIKRSVALFASLSD